MTAGTAAAEAPKHAASASMIDYDWKQNTFGIGITLNDFLDRPEER